MGAFGEGVAVLAAAGSPDIAPLAAYPRRDQIDWDLNMERVGARLQKLNQFVIDAIHGALRNDAVAHEGLFSVTGDRGTRSDTGWPRPLRNISDAPRWLRP